MKAVFIHDHKFPFKDGQYYHSYGFDADFFERYLNIFDFFEIVGRYYIISDEETGIKVNKNNIIFNTIESFKEITSSVTLLRIKNSIEKSDIVIIRLPSVLGILALGYAKKYKKPYVVEVVGSAWDSLWNQHLKMKVVAPLFSLLCKKAISEAKFVIYVTEKYLQEKYPTYGQSISCSNVSLEIVDYSLVPIRANKIKNFEMKGKILIGTCATLNLYKGQQDIIKAISILKTKGFNVEYQLVGAGDQTYLKSIAQKYGVINNIIFIGKLPNRDVLDWLKTIDIYVQPSLTEGLPRALIEAMSRGCPAIGSNAGGIPELLDKEFIFNKGDAKSFCNIFINLTERSLIEQMTQNQQLSKKYLKATLQKKRKDFFEKFIEENNNNVGETI